MSDRKMRSAEDVAREVLRCEPWAEGTDGDFIACRFHSGQWPCEDGDVRDLASLIRTYAAEVAARALEEHGAEVQHRVIAGVHEVRVASPWTPYEREAGERDE